MLYAVKKIFLVCLKICKTNLLEIKNNFGIAVKKNFLRVTLSTFNYINVDKNFDCHYVHVF